MASVNAFADAYLDALKDAAGGVTVDPLSRKRETPAAVSDEPAVMTDEGLASPGDMPPNLDMGGLESYLKDSFVGSYTFFSRLSDERKQRVFQAYKSHPLIAHIRDEIKRQYLQR